VNKGIRDIFLNFKISIYNRWGALLWEGNNNTSDWDGYASKGILLDNQRCLTEPTITLSGLDQTTLFRWSDSYIYLISC
jgi:hypothetical protein